MVIQEAKGPQDPGVPVCVFPGPITRLLGGKFPIPDSHPLEQIFRSIVANTRAYKNTLGEED